MAGYGQIANDLIARAKKFENTRFEDDARALRRAAAAIRELIEENRVLSENTTVTGIVVLEERGDG